MRRPRDWRAAQVPLSDGSPPVPAYHPDGRPVCHCKRLRQPRPGKPRRYHATGNASRIRLLQGGSVPDAGRPEVLRFTGRTTMIVRAVAAESSRAIDDARHCDRILGRHCGLSVATALSIIRVGKPYNSSVGPAADERTPPPVPLCSCWAGRSEQAGPTPFPAAGQVTDRSSYACSSRRGPGPGRIRPACPTVAAGRAHRPPLSFPRHCR